MPCESNISNLNKNIHFLERKLIENSQLIDKLASNFDKLNIFSFERSSSIKNSVFESHVKQNRGSFCLFLNDLLSC